MPTMPDATLRGRFARPLALAIALSLGSGCTHLLVPTDKVAPAFSEALEENDYDAAQALLNRLPASHPGAQALHQQFEAEAAAYENAVAEKAVDQANRGRWVEAFEVLDEGQDHWDDSPAIANALEQLKAREARLYRRLHAELLLAEADWITTRQAQTDELSRLHRRDARRLAVSWDRRTSALADHLEKLAERFIKSEDWIGARKLLVAAGKVSGEDMSERIAAVEDRMPPPAERRDRSGEQKARAGKLLAEYEASGDMSDLFAARKHIFSHNNQGQLDTYAARLEDISRRRFEQGVIAGDQLYAAGRYREARDTWQAILQLYPNDAELQKKLERANKVLENLKALSREQRH